MKRSSVGIVTLIGIVGTLSGCVSANPQEITVGDLSGGVIKSEDKGTTYAPAVNIDDRRTIARTDVLDIAIDANNNQKIYLGTLGDGLWVTENAGGNWRKLNVPLTKNYAVIAHPTNANVAYSAGVFNGRGKIARTDDGGENWKEVYTEPADGTVVLTLAINSFSPETVYAGTSGGVIVVTRNEGNTWENVFQAQNPVRRVAVDPKDGNTIFAMTFEDSLLRTRDGGKTFVDMKSEWDARRQERLNECRRKQEECTQWEIDPGQVFSFDLDPGNAGVGYVGTDSGLYRFDGYGESWRAINVIASSKAFPLRAVAVGSSNSQEIYYNSAQAIYRSLDGGVNWFPFQLDADKASVSIMKHDLANPGTLYVGLRKAQ